MITHTIDSYKARAGRICDDVTRERPEHRLPMAWAAREITTGRRTKGFRAAVLTGLVVGALIERGFPDKAEELLKILSAYAEFTGEKDDV